MRNHTPGPWRFDTSGPHSKYIAKLYPISKATGQQCGPAFASLHIGRENIQKANAKLIESAPMLATALQQIATGAAEASDGLAYEEITRIASDALAKAGILMERSR